MNFGQLWLQCVLINPFNPKHLEWYSPSLDLEHTIQVCRGEPFHVLYTYLYNSVIKYR